MQWFVAIGASVGGLRALSVILSQLPRDFPGTLAIVQHRRADDGALLCRLMSRHTPLPVLEPDHGTPIRSGHVYVAPPDYHLLVEPGSFAISVDPPVCCSRPSIDVLFESAAAAYRWRALGVILTGANTDGASGAAALAAVGAQVIVQAPETAECPTCPKAALARVPDASVLPLAEIGRYLNAACREKAAPWRQVRAPSP
jgi:two-component system chemotaxis response regulator CheB